MRYWAVCLCAVTAGIVYAQGPVQPFNLTNQPIEYEIANDSSGTVTGSLVKHVNTGGALKVAKTAITDTNNAFGCVQSGAGTSGTAQVAVLGGGVQCLFDNNPTTTGDFIIVSTSTVGTASDGGATIPTGILNLGRVAETHAACGSPPCGPYTVFLLTPDALGAGGTGILASPNTTQTIQGTTGATIGLVVRQPNTTNTADTFQVLDKGGNAAIGVDKSNNVRFRGGSPWIDVTAYGATGNGSTDDATAIQNALNALPAAGGTVFFPCGVYKVGTGLTMTASQMSWRIEGEAGTSWGSSQNQCARIVTAAAITVLTIGTGSTTQSGGTIEHITLQDISGSTSGDTTQGIAIGGLRLNGVSWVIVSDVQADYFNNSTTNQGYGFFDDGGSSSAQFSNHNKFYNIRTDAVHYGLLLTSGNHDGPDIYSANLATSKDSTHNYGIFCADSAVCASTNITQSKMTMWDSANAGTGVYLGGNDNTILGLHMESYRTGGALHGNLASGTNTVLLATNDYSSQAVCNGIVNGNAIAGANIPGGTTVTACSGTTVTMSANATGTASAQAVTVTVGTCCQSTGLEFGATSTRNQVIANSTRYNTAFLADAGADHIDLRFLDVSSTTALTDNSTTSNNYFFDSSSAAPVSHINTTGTLPSLATCGTSPTISTGSTDSAGFLQVGTGSPTACTVNFAKAWARAPFCVASAATSTTPTATGVTAVSTTAVTFTFAATPGAAGRVYYQCGGH